MCVCVCVCVCVLACVYVCTYSYTLYTVKFGKGYHSQRLKSLSVPNFWSLTLHISDYLIEIDVINLSVPMPF